MKDTAIVLTLTGYAIAFDGVLDDQRYNDRQDAKRRLRETIGVVLTGKGAR